MNSLKIMSTATVILLVFVLLYLVFGSFVGQNIWHWLGFSNNPFTYYPNLLADQLNRLSSLS